MPDTSQYEMLVRLDERTQRIHTDVQTIRSEYKERIDRLELNLESKRNEDLAKLQEHKENCEDQFKSISETYVKKEQFAPVQRLVYGVVSIILTSVVGALVSLVVMKPPHG